MKKSFRIVLVCLLAVACVLAMTACGSKAPAAAEPAAADDGAAAISGETIDSGAFAALCPEGWMNVPQTDLFAEEDADGNRPLNPDQLQFCKGAKSEWDVFSCPSVTITLLSEGTTAEETIEGLSFWYEPFEEVTFTVDGVEYKGAKCSMEGLDEGKYYTYDYVMVPVGERLFQISTITGMPDTGDTGISTDSADVQAILASIVLD